MIAIPCSSSSRRMDAAGKDGTIKHVMSGVNPQGVEVHSFQATFRRGAGPQFPVALDRRCRSAAASGFSTARITKRC